MLNSKMSLINAINYEPSQDEMAALPLDVIVYIKVTIVSLYKEDNYDFIRYLFTSENIDEYIKDKEKITFFDYDASKTNQERYVTLYEMYSLYNFQNISDFLKELLEGYEQVADVIIDLYTHDDKKYRLSNLDGIVKLEECIRKV